MCSNLGSVGTVMTGMEMFLSKLLSVRTVRVQCNDVPLQTVKHSDRLWNEWPSVMTNVIQPQTVKC